MRILLIEDNEDDTELIRDMLGQNGVETFDLDCVKQLSTGLACLAEAEVDVVLLDLSLPDSQGLATFERVHAQAPGVPIIVLTALDQDKVAISAVQKGAQDYLVKGKVDENSLVCSIRYAIERQRLVTENARLYQAVQQELAERKRAEEERARLLAETEQHLQRLAILHDINLATTSTLDLRGLLNLLLEKVDLLLPSSAMEIWLLSREAGVLERTACRNLEEEEWKGRKIEGTPPLLKTVMEKKAPVVVRNVQTDPRTRDPEFFRKHGLVSYLGVPVIAKGEFLGVLTFITKEEHAFSKNEIEFFTTLVAQAAIAIRNSRLFEQTKSQANELERTNQELTRSNNSLERFNRLAVGREQRMIELKCQVNELSKALGKSPPYDLSFLQKGSSGGTREDV